MESRVHLYHALDQLRLPDKNGKAPTFSIEFVVSKGEDKGQLRFIEEAVVNHFSAGKTKEILEKGKATKDNKHQSYNQKDKGVFTIRIIQSDYYKKGEIRSPKKIFITRINGLKTHI